MEKFELIAPCHFGMEAVLKREILDLGYEITKVEDGKVTFEAEAQGIGSCWIHRAKEEFESEEGKELLRSLGIEGDYEGIGHCILGYADGDAPKAATRKA